MRQREPCKKDAISQSQVYASRFCEWGVLNMDGRPISLFSTEILIKTLSLQQQEQEIAAIRGSLANCKSMSAADITYMFAQGTIHIAQCLHIVPTLHK